MARPDLIRILASRIPKEKLHYNKRVIATHQDDTQVTITCADNTTYSGTILVGTDGAYSSIRQNMFKELEAKGLMHTSDAEPMQSDYDCVVGVTGPMDTTKYPLLKEELCEFKIVMGKTLPMTVSPIFPSVVGFSVAVVCCCFWWYILEIVYNHYRYKKKSTYKTDNEILSSTCFPFL